MNRDNNETDEEFMEEIVEDLGYRPKGGKNHGSGEGPGQGGIPTYLILGSVGLLLLLAVAAFFLLSRGGGRPEEFGALEARVNRLEERMAVLARLEERTSALAKLEERIARVEGTKGLKSLAGLEDRLSRLEKESKELQQEIRKVGSPKETPEPQRPPARPEPKKPSPPPQRKPAPQAKERYHTVQAGENLYMIARKYGISVDRLRLLNKLSPRASLQAGQKLLVGP